MDALIEVESISKTFFIKKCSKGFWPNFTSLLKPHYEQLQALKDISFSIKKGEKVAFLGANGAGKSTAIKILTGILYPTAGQVRIMGLTPWQQRRSLSHHIGIIFGQRSQLWYNLPARDTYHLLGRMYDLSSSVFNDRLNEITHILDLRELLDKPVRQLSLGQRMRCEMGAALLHRPAILFLDEPTIGVDIDSKMAIRGYLNRLSSAYGTTIFLTSHDVGDIDMVCDRAIILKRGEIVIDSPIKALKQNVFTTKRVSLKTFQEHIKFSMNGVKIIENSAHNILLEVNTKECPIDNVVGSLLMNYSVLDISIMSPPLEEIITSLFKHELI